MLLLLFSLLAASIIPTVSGLLNYAPPDIVDGACVVYFDYRNPLYPHLTVLPEAHAPNFTRWQTCARACSDFGKEGHEQRWWNGSCQPSDKLNCKLSYIQGKLFMAGACPALFKDPLVTEAEEPLPLVHTSQKFCLLLADARANASARTIVRELSRGGNNGGGDRDVAALLSRDFGDCIHRCERFSSPGAVWETTCRLASGAECVQRRDAAGYALRGVCPTIDARGEVRAAEVPQALTPAVAVAQQLIRRRAANGSGGTSKFGINSGLFMCLILAIAAMVSLG